MKRAMGSFCLGLAAVPLAAMLAATLLATPVRAACGDAPAAGVDWSKCEKRRLILRGRDLSKGVFLRTDFGRTDLAEANLAGADLSEAIFERARLAGADLSGAVLTKADGDRANFSKAVLKGADLGKVEMSRTDFSGADLTGANLQKAELGRANMADSRLDGADLSRAEIARAIFAGASLKGADMTGAYTYLTHFESADLSAVKGLTQDQLEAACGNEETQLPAGLAVPDAWPCAAEEPRGPGAGQNPATSQLQALSGLCMLRLTALSCVATLHPTTIRSSERSTATGVTAGVQQGGNHDSHFAWCFRGSTRRRLLGLPGVFCLAIAGQRNGHLRVRELLTVQAGWP